MEHFEDEILLFENEDRWLENGENLVDYLCELDDLHYIAYLLSLQEPIRWRKIYCILGAYMYRYEELAGPHPLKYIVDRVIFWTIIRCRQQNIQPGITLDMSLVQARVLDDIFTIVLNEGPGIPIHSFRDLFLFFLLKMPGVTMENGDIVIRDDSNQERRRKEALYQAIRMVRPDAGPLPPRPLPHQPLPVPLPADLDDEDVHYEHLRHIRRRVAILAEQNIPFVQRGVQVDYIQKLWMIFTLGRDPSLYTHIADYLLEPRGELKLIDLEDPLLPPYILDEIKSYLEFEKVKDLHHFGKSNKKKNQKNQKKVSKRKQIKSRNRQ